MLTSSEAKYTQRCATSSAVHNLPVFCLAMKSLKAWEVKETKTLENDCKLCHRFKVFKHPGMPKLHKNIQ